MRTPAYRELFVRTALALAMFTFSVAPLRADRQSAPTCMALITPSELNSALGEPMQDAGANDRGGGETDCAWTAGAGRPGFRSVAVQFYDLQYIKADVETGTPEKFFEQMLTDAEAIDSTKREVLKGIGVQAALVPTAPQTVAFVRRADGVARIVSHNITRDKLIAVARAVVAD